MQVVSSIHARKSPICLIENKSARIFLWIILLIDSKELLILDLNSSFKILSKEENIGSKLITEYLFQIHGQTIDNTSTTRSMYQNKNLEPLYVIS